MTWDLPKEYLGIEAEKERLDKKLKSVSRQVSGQSDQIEKDTITDILGRRWVKHSTGTEFQEDYLR